MSTSSPPADAPPLRTSRAALGASLLVLVAIATTYRRALAGGPVLDDVYLTLKNPYVQSLGGLARIVSTDIMGASALEETSGYYRPVAMASFLVNRLLTGNTAGSYHAGNLVLHALNALLLGVVLARSAPARSRVAILVPVLLFAVAPLNVEAVTWISGRFDLLGTTFALGALALNMGSGARDRVWAVVLVAASLFCKESFVVVPVLVYLHDAWVLRRPPRAEAGKYAGMAAAVAVMFVARAVVGVPSASVAASTGVGAMVRCYAFLLTTYARALVYPAYLDPLRTYVAPAAAAAGLVIAAALGACGGAVAALRRHPDDGRVRAGLFALAWILIALAPMSLMGPNLDIVGERYAYFPFVGAFLALALPLDATWLRAPRPALVASIAVALGIVASAWRAEARVGDWATEATLEEASLRQDPDNAYALERLGSNDAFEGRYASATPLLTRSLEKNPGNARAWTALCYVHLNERQHALAEAECERSLAIDAGNPRAWINLAGARANQARWATGLEAATRATGLKPRSAEAHYLRAACLANLGSLAEARHELDVALDIDPSHAGANNLLRQFRARAIP